MKALFIKTFLYLMFGFLLVQTGLAQSDKIVIINKNSDWGEVFFDYINDLDIHTNKFDLVEQKSITNDSYVITLESATPLFVYFSHNFKLQGVYLYTGDTLEFRLTDSNVHPYRLSGNRHSAELMFLSALESKYGHMIPYNEGLSVTKRLDFNYVLSRSVDAYSNAVKFLNVYKDSVGFSERYYQTISSALYYRYLTELLFPYYTADQAGFDNSIIPSFYKIKLQELTKETMHDSLLYLNEYRTFLKNYAKFMTVEAGIKRVTFNSIIDVYMTAFRGRVKDYLLFDGITKNFRKGTLDSIQQRNLLSYIKDIRFHDSLLALLSKSSTIITEKSLLTELETPKGERLTWKDLLKKYSGKIIYVDFWASWCGPCISEMPASAKLQHKFQKDSVEFIYISIDHDKQKWQSKMASLSLQSQNHFCMEYETSFAKELGIPPIPRYMLIGKNGRVIAIDAPRPGSSEINGLIATHIKSP